MKVKSLSRIAVMLIAFELALSTASPTFGASGVVSAFVSAQQDEGPSRGYGYTNSSGYYEIGYDLLPGPYTVTASAFGYIDGVQHTNISSLLDEKHIDFNLNRSALIIGKVVGFDGLPVAGAYVRLYNNLTGGYVTYTYTDSAGVYVFATNIPTGVYHVAVSFEFEFTSVASQVYSGANYTGPPTYPHRYAPYLPSGYISGSSSNFSAVAGQQAAGPTVVLQGSAVIQGTIRDQFGSPVANASVYAYNTMGSNYIFVLSGPDGKYRISYEIAKSVYSLRAIAYGYVSPYVEVDASAGGIIAQDLTLNRSASVYGFIRRAGDGLPITSAYLYTYSLSGVDYAYSYTDGSGYYSISSGLTPGNHSLYVYVGLAYIGPFYFWLSEGQATRFDVSLDASRVTGMVHGDNLTGPALGYASMKFSSAHVPSWYSVWGQVQADGTYSVLLGIPSGYMGMTVPVNITVSHYGYNTRTFTVNLTLGTDLNLDLYLTKGELGASAKVEGFVSGAGGPGMPFTFNWWRLTFDNYTFMVGMNSTSSVDYLSPYLLSKYIYISARGPEGTVGHMTVWVPDSVMQGPFTVVSRTPPYPTIVSVTDNGTYTAVEFTYFEHNYNYMYLYSTSAVPEFPGVALLAALGSAFFVSMLVERRLRLQ